MPPLSLAIARPSGLLLCVGALAMTGLTIQTWCLVRARRAHRRYRRCVENDIRSKYHLCSGPIHEFRIVEQMHDNDTSMVLTDIVQDETQKNTGGGSILGTLEVWGAKQDGRSVATLAHATLNQSIPLRDMELLAAVSLPKQIRNVKIGSTLLTVYPPYIEFCVDAHIRSATKPSLLKMFQQLHETIPRQLDAYVNPWRPLQVLMWEAREGARVTAVFVNEHQPRMVRAEADDVDLPLSAANGPNCALIPSRDMIATADSTLHRLQDRGVWLLGEDAQVHRRLKGHFGCWSWQRWVLVHLGNAFCLTTLAMCLRRTMHTHT